MTAQYVQSKMWLTSTEAARELNNTVPYVHKLVRQGKLKDYQIGGYLYICPHSLAAFQRFRDRTIESTEPLLTIREAADLLGLTQNTVYIYARNGTIRSIKVDGQIRLYESAVEQHLQRRGNSNGK